MNSTVKEEVQAVQCDLVILEGMIRVLIEGAYAGLNPELIGNALEIMEEFLGARADRLDRIGWEAGC